MEELILPVPVLLKQIFRVTLTESSRAEQSLVVVIELFGIHHLEVTKQSLLTTNRTLEVHTQFITLLTGLRGDNDYTTGSRSTVDTR